MLLCGENLSISLYKFDHRCDVLYVLDHPSLYKVVRIFIYILQM